MLNIIDLDIKFYDQESRFWNTAVNKISFSVNKGTVLGIVGESGSGKSVTSLAIMRLLQSGNEKIEGTIRFDNIDLQGLSDEQIRHYRGNRMAMIFQEPMTSLNPVFTCGDQVREAIMLHQKFSAKEAKAKTIALFEEVLLPGPATIFDTYPHQLSGGQKQRVMIAMALSCNPELLIADEPTTALDVTVQQNILQLLLKIKKERKMSMIFISHDLGVISEIADEIAVMYKGEIVEQGTVQHILNTPSHPYTKGLLACRPNPAYRLKKLPVVADFLGANQSKPVSYLLNENSYTQQEIDSRKNQLYAQKPILELQHISTWFPVRNGLFGTSNSTIKAVNDVSLHVFPGETLGLVGESGCGKTTLGRTVLRLIEPTHGEIIFDGNNITTLKPEELRKLRREIQLIFQDPFSALNPRISIGNTLMEPLQVHQLFNTDQQRKTHILELLEMVGLNPDHFNRYPHEFSGGQRQRIVIARALALQPKLIICDESVSALDVSVQAQVLNLLRDLQKELGLTYIFISHDLAVVKHLSDRMIIMNQGKIEEEGFPENIYNAPKSDYTKRLIDAIPGLK